jgi:hypothetical protein
MIVRESLEFERGGNPLKQLDIGILTWDKLKPGNILQNKRIIYPVMSQLFFSQEDIPGDHLPDSDEVRTEKYWIVTKIHQEKNYFDIELIWAGIFRHAINIAEKIKYGTNVRSPRYSANHSIEEWDDWFKILQPKEYDLEESVHFERGSDPKVSMDIGNKWTRIKPGDIIECIRKNVVRERNNQDIFTFEDYIFTPETYLGDKDYYFDLGNVAFIKQIVDFEDKSGLRISIIPFSSEEEVRESIKRTDLLSKSLYSTVKGTAPISTWAKYFKVL